MWLLAVLLLQAVLPTADELSVTDQTALHKQVRDAAITVVDSAWASAWKLRWPNREAFLVSAWTAREGGMQSGPRLFLLGPSMEGVGLRVLDLTASGGDANAYTPLFVACGSRLFGVTDVGDNDSHWGWNVVEVRPWSLTDFGTIDVGGPSENEMDNPSSGHPEITCASSDGGPMLTFDSVVVLDPMKQDQRALKAPPAHRVRFVLKDGRYAAVFVRAGKRGR